MDKKKAKECRDVLNQIFAENKDHLGACGIAVSLGNGSFDTGLVKFQTVCADVNADGTVETPERSDYKKLAESYDMKVEWLDKTFTTNMGEDYIVRGLKPRSKNAVVVERVSDGKLYKMRDSSVASAFERAEVKPVSKVEPKSIDGKKPLPDPLKVIPPNSLSIEEIVNRAAKELV